MGTRGKSSWISPLCISLGLSGAILSCGGNEKIKSLRLTSQKSASNDGSKSGGTLDAEGQAALNRTRDDVVELVKDIGTLPPTVGGDEEPRPVCSADASVDAKGLCKTEETIENGGLAFVCSTQRYSLAKVPDKFVALNPNADALWPGALIQTKPLMVGVLDPVPVGGRTPGDLTMTMATGSAGRFTASLAEPSLATVTEALKGILNESVGINTPAKFYYKMDRIYSKEQLAIAIGINVKTSFNLDISASLDFQTNDETNHILLEFTQEYYTMAFSPNAGGNGFFKSNVEPSDLYPYTQEGNPLGYISSVTYGRKIYLLFESEMSSKDLESAIAASFQGYGVEVGGKLGAKYKKLLSDSKIKAYVVGGNAASALAAMSSQDDSGQAFVDLKKLLVEGANFSQGNAGVPISYTVRHVQDSSQIRSEIISEYNARECSPIADVRNPSVWDLKITLNRIEIAQEVGWCEPPLNEHGEFAACLRVQVGDAGELQTVFCDVGERKAKGGDTLAYGAANHSAIIPLLQVPGQKLHVSGYVHENDIGDTFEEILTFESVFELSNTYEWLGWKPEVNVSGVRNGCRATLFYDLEWISQRND